MQRIFAVTLAVLSAVAFLPCASAQDPSTGPAPPATVVVPAAQDDSAALATDTTASPAPRAPAPDSDPGIDAPDLSAYVDGLVDAAMERDGIAGITVAIVDREGPLLLRGYGIAAQSPRRAVDPQRTLFRIASISKTFTYLLALQLVDAGRLDLDAPVNSYLPPELQLPDDDYVPVLVRHLFTHTAGYEDSAMGHLFADKPERVLASAEYLQRHRPARVRAPGTHAVYSNYSVALLGALVAHIEGVAPGSESGASFDTLAERALFAPMGLRRTTFREPLSAGDPRNAGPQFKGQWSQGFKRTGGGFKAQAFEHIAHTGPAGGASSTAADMGRYMRMLLNGGEIDGVRVLSPSAYARLQGEPLFRNAPDVGGFTYGFFDIRMGEVRAIGHGGATSWFHSGMVVVPELGIGVFISTNTDSGRRFAAQFPEKVLERYFERARAPPPPAIPKGFDATRFAGKYSSARANFSTAEKLFLSFNVEVGAADDNSLVVTAGDDSSRWVPESALRFREVEGQGRIVFFADDDGRITGFASALGHNVLHRVGFFDVGNSVLLVLGLAALTVVLVLTGAWLRRHRRIRDQPQARFSALWLYLTAVLWLLLLALAGAFIASAAGDQTRIFYDYPGTLLTVTLWAALPVMLASLVCLPLLWPAWGARDWGFWRKLRHTLAVGILALAAWILWHWNLVGWKL